MSLFRLQKFFNTGIIPLVQYRLQNGLCKCCNAKHIITLFFVPDVPTCHRLPTEQTRVVKQYKCSKQNGNGAASLDSTLLGTLLRQKKKKKSVSKHRCDGLFLCCMCCCVMTEERHLSSRQPQQSVAIRPRCRTPSRRVVNAHRQAGDSMK